nr:cytochrome P450 [Tanacetum cinerariifolium]
MYFLAEHAARKAAKSEVDEDEDKEEGDEEEDEKEGDDEEEDEEGDEEDEEEGDEKDDDKKVDEEDDEGEDEEDAIVKDKEYEEEEEKGKGEVVMSKGKKIKVEDKEVGEKKQKKDSELSSSEDEKPLKKKTKGKGKGPRVVHVTAEKVHEILGLPIGGISLYDLPKRREDDEFVQLWLSQFASKKKKRIFATDIAKKLVRSTRVDFMFKVNFLMFFANVMGKADTMRAFVNLSVVWRIREDTNIAGVDCEGTKSDQNIKTNPAAVKTEEAFEKPKPTVNVKELAEKPKEPAEKAQKAPQNVKPKLEAVKTKEAAEKPMPAENVKELAEKPKEPAGDDYQVVPAATVTKVEDREEFEVETFTQWIEGNIDWVGEVINIISAAYLDDKLHAWPRVVEPVNMVQPSTPKRVFSSPSKEYVKPVKPVNSPYMCRRIDVTTRCKRIEFVLVTKLAKMRPFIPKLKWRTSNNHVDCGVFAMIHMENYVGDAAKNWEFGLCEESDEQLLRLQRTRYKIATKIMLHQFNVVSNKVFDFAFTFETKYTEQAGVSMIVDAIKNRNNRDPPKQVKETDAASVVVAVNEVLDQVKESSVGRSDFLFLTDSEW